MAHFKDREQDDFESRTCSGCVHYYDMCAILSLHDKWNEEQVTESDKPTDILVAQAKKTALLYLVGVEWDCAMFRAVPKEPVETSPMQRQREEVRRTLLGEHYFER